MNKKDKELLNIKKEIEERITAPSRTITSSIVIENVAKYGGEIEYRKENGTKTDGTVYEARS
jgi:hypothetical protein